jgi:VanZ family protein
VLSVTKWLDVPQYRLILRLLWLAAVGVVILFSLLPSSSAALQAVDALQINDKIEHLCAYAGLAFLPVLHERWRTFVWIALALMAMGIGLEFGQLLSEGRQFEVADMVADGCGLLAGFVGGLLPRLWIRSRNS